MKRAIIRTALVAFVTIFILAPRPSAAQTVVIGDNPTISYEGTGEDYLASTNEWFFRCGTTAAIFTFTGIDTHNIGDVVLLRFNNRGVTNHLDGDFGLDGCLDITINPGEAGSYTVPDVLFDNVDPENLIANWGETTEATYETTATVTISKSDIVDGTVVIKVSRDTDDCDNDPVAPSGENCPIAVCSDSPTMPEGCAIAGESEGCYDDENPHTVHLGIKTTGNQYVAADGEVTLWAPLIPAVSEWGLVVMLLLVVAAGTVVIRRRRAVVA